MRALGILIIPLVLVVAATTSAGAQVVVLELHDTIQPASLRYLERGLRQAAADRAQLVVIELDTPGGLLESLRSMTAVILGSPVPVVVYVSPSGARAASAGFFLVLASDVAAMAPGTNTGAAHPVAIGDRPKDNSQAPAERRDASLDKAVEDTAALARSLAEGRERSVAEAERAVVESASFTADEARARGLIELIATDRAQLLQLLDGRSIKRFDGRTQTLQLHGAAVVVVERTLAERVLAVIASPQVAYLLLMLGAIGLLIELMAPGLFVPGIAGALALLLGMYGLSVLPVTVSGALLIAAGLALLVVEVFVSSYGLLAVAGIASFVVGSLMLIEAPIPELAIGPDVVGPVAVVLVVITAFLALRAVRSRGIRPQSGVDSMIGESGEVVDHIEPDRDGKVFVHGEYWAAASTQPLSTGAKVRVEAIDGLRLRVSPVTAQQRGGIS